MADMYDLKANVPASAAPKPATAGLATLMPADPKKGYSTPYYAAYTNDGDMAGAVMVAEGQKVRLVDKLTGDVVYEGVGPQAAEIATATANSISKDKGRGAAWAIQKPTEDGGWVSMAEERYDPKKQGFWGKLADIALPVLGAILAPMTGGLSMLGAAGAAGVGAAGGSLLASASNRRDMDEALKRAAIAGVTAGVGSKVMPMIGSKLAASSNPAAQVASDAFGAVMKPLNAGTRFIQNAAGATGNVIQGGLNAAGELIVTPAVTSGLTGGALGSAIGSGAGGVLAGAGGQDIAQGGSGVDTLGGTEIEGVDVTGTGTDAATGGALTSVLADPIAVGDYTQVGQTDTPVDEVVVEARKPGVVTPVGDVIDPKQLADAVEKGVGFEAPTAEELLDGKPGISARLLEWIKANPGLAARLGLTVAGLVGGAAGGDGSGKGGGIPPGFATAGTPGSLSDRFRAQLPAASGPFSDLSARNVSMTPEQWKTYGQRSAMSFFNNVPVRPSGIMPAKPPGGQVVGPRVNPSEVEPGLTVTNAPATGSTPSAKTEAPYWGGLRRSGKVVWDGDAGMPFETEAEAEDYLNKRKTEAEKVRNERLAFQDFFSKADPSKVVAYGGGFYGPVINGGRRRYATETEAKSELAEMEAARNAAARPTDPTVPLSVSGTTGANMGFAANTPATTGRPLGVQGTIPTQPVPGGSLEVEFDDLRRQRARQSGFNPTAPSSVSSTTGANMNSDVLRPQVLPDRTITRRPLGVQGAIPTQLVEGFDPTLPPPVSSTTAGDMNRQRENPSPFAVAMQRLGEGRRSQPLPGPAKGFKTGGFAVRGPGTGRSDEIPARLSDGEYVIDAETVALLGDGSTQAGSKRLDEFRVNIRKHKGKQLSKGKFSHDARKPEAYLQGGRV